MLQVSIPQNDTIPQSVWSDKKNILSKLIKLGGCTHACTFPSNTPIFKKYDDGILPKPEKFIMA